MNKPLTIKQLLEACKKEVAEGHGDYTVMLSNDDEGNGYHYCWYEFTGADELVDEFDLETSIAPIEKTIVLG